MRLATGMFALLVCSSATAAPNDQTNADKDVVLTTNIDRTDIALFIPAKLSVIRFVLINPADKNVAPGTAWTETVRRLGGAQIGALMENVDKRSNRVPAIMKAVDAALAQFAQDTGHRELVHAPLFWAGFSKGGGFSAAAAQDQPERTIGFGNVCGWVANSEKDLTAGGLIVIGGKPDGFKMLDDIPRHYDPARNKGAPWTIALQWECGHEYANASTLLMPYVEALVRLRLPKDADPRHGPVKLVPLDLKTGWLGNRESWATRNANIATYASYKGERDAAVWLPDESVAAIWRSFQSKNSPVQITVATADQTAKLPIYSAKSKRTLMVPPDMAVTLSVDVTKGTQATHFEYYDGATLLGTSAADKPEWIWRKIPDGPRAIYVRYTLADGFIGISNPALVVVNRSTR